MTDAPLISVVMSVYKEPEEWLNPAVGSILSQTYKNIEFIIVNDNPTDEQMRRILSGYAQSDPRIRIVENECNMGLALSLNHGLQYVTGEYVARMDADDISIDTRLEIELNYLIENNCDMVSSYADWIDEAGNTIKAGVVKDYSPECVMAQLRYDNMMCHPSWLVKTSVYNALSGYRNINPAQDYDFTLRALSHGYRLGICDRVLIRYRMSTSGISRQKPLKQMLTARYLKTHFKAQDSISQAVIDKYIAGRFTQKRSERYGKALELLHKASSSGKLKAFFLLLRALFTSHFILENIRCMTATRLIRRKYGKSG